MTDLVEEIRRAAAEDGLQELILRVSRYDCPPGGPAEPAAWQAIAKYRGRVSGPWGVGIRAQPVAAAVAALQSGRGQVENAPPPAEDIFG